MRLHIQMSAVLGQWQRPASVEQGGGMEGVDGGGDGFYFGRFTYKISSGDDDRSGGVEEERNTRCLWSHVINPSTSYYLQ